MYFKCEGIISFPERQWLDVTRGEILCSQSDKQPISQAAKRCKSHVIVIQWLAGVVKSFNSSRNPSLDDEYSTHYS